MESFRDELVGPGVTDLPERFFDRFVFNLHRTDSTTPSIIFGLGIHPVHDSVDGFVILTTGTEQRNVRFATELSASGWSSCGPLSWRVVEPMTTWHVALGPNPAGLEFDLTWRARAPAWGRPARVGRLPARRHGHAAHAGLVADRPAGDVRLGRHARDRYLRVRADAEQVVLLPADARRVSGFRPSAGPCSLP